MKIQKWVATLLAAILVLCSFPALAAVGDATILRRGLNDFDSGLASIAYLDGTIYVLTYDNDAIYTWKDGDAAAARHEWAEKIASEEEGGSVELRSLISDGEALYLLVFDTLYEAEMNEFLGAYLYEVAIGEDGTVCAEESLELEWDDMIESYDENEHSREVRMPFSQEGILYFLTYADNGNALVAYDLEEGEMLSETEIPDLSAACPYKDGRVLAMASRYSEEKGNYSFEFAAFDPESEESEPLFTLESDSYFASYIAYDPDEDAILYVMAGEIWKITGNDPASATSVNAMPLDSWTDSAPILTEDKCLVVMDYETVCKLSTDPSGRPETQLVVQDNYVDPVQSAYYDFTNQHGDVEVVMVSTVEELLQAMLNRSDKVDVYCLFSGSADYEAIFNRGYMAELSDSEVLTALAEGCYPAFRELLFKDGELVAVPVSLNAYCSSYNPQALELLGLTKEDMPRTWPEYFEFLQNLPKLLKDHPEVVPFEPYFSQETARDQLLYRMVEEYLLYIAQPGNAFAFDTPIFRAMLEGLESVDFQALGLPEEEEEDPSYDFEKTKILFPGYMSDISPYAMRPGTADEPMLLALGDGMEPIIQAQMEVLFVNPYSQNRELSIQFLEAVVGRLDEMLLTKLSPEKNDPIPNSYYERSLQSYDETLETLRRQLEQADEDDKPQYERQIEELEEYRADYIQTGAWDATEESIARYREYAEFMVISRYAGMDGEAGQEFYTLMQKYRAGEISIDEFIQGADQKLQMMMLEGA